jgi:hypothetical protein
MKNQEPIDTQTAERALAVANTPLFLLRKLRADPTVAELRQNYSAAEILSALKRSLKKTPKTLSEAVTPYLYLVALSGLPDVRFLREAETFAAPNTEWYSYLARLLVETYRPTSFKTIKVQNAHIASPLRTQNSTATSRITIVVSE